MIDTHIHADTRSSEDFEIMYNNGIETAITCSYYPYTPNNNPDILINHFERIMNFETERVNEYNINLEVALGLHPVNIIDNDEKIYEYLRKRIEEEKIIAIGEIGLEKDSEKERETFKKQLQIAEETQTKVIVHTPRKNKKEVLEGIKEVIFENINPKLVVIDHINYDTIEDVIDTEFTIGLTVQPHKLSPNDAIAILDEYGFDRFLLNSDMSNKPSNILSIPNTIKKLKNRNYSQKNIDKIAFNNAKNFFNIWKTIESSIIKKLLLILQYILKKSKNNYLISKN